MWHLGGSAGKWLKKFYRVMGEQGGDQLPLRIVVNVEERAVVIKTSRPMWAKVKESDEVKKRRHDGLPKRLVGYDGLWYIAIP